MVQVRNKKRIFISLFVVAVLGVAYATWVYLGNNKKADVVVTDVVDAVKKLQAEQIQEDTNTAYATPELKSLNDAYSNKDYDSVVANADKVCKDIADDPLYLCYTLYAKALAKKGEFEKLEALATEMLAKEAVQNEVTLKNSWTITRDSAKNGVDPEFAKPITEDEARSE